MSSSTPTDWTQIVTWGIVLIGWYVVHVKSLDRERRKERREVVRGAIQDLKEIEKLAVGFHTSNKFDSLAASELTWRVNRAIRKLQREPLSKLEIPVAEMVRFRRCITLANTDASTFKQQTPDGELILGIRSAVDDLSDTLEVQCELKFD